jgi:hypothetical protein
MRVGDLILDALTGKESTIVSIISQGLFRDAYQLSDRSWLSGFRYSWEVTSAEEREAEPEIPEYQCSCCGHTTVCWDEFKNHFHFCTPEDSL